MDEPPQNEGDEELEVDADDEELTETPPDVIAELGFDPKELTEGVSSDDDSDGADIDAADEGA